MQSFFQQKKSVVMEAVLVIAVIGAMIYAYTLFGNDGDTTTTSAQANEQLMGQNLVLFLKAMNQERLSFNSNTFMNSELIKLMRDFSQSIFENETRGRADPFTPYAASRPVR